MRRPLVPLAWFITTLGACALAWSAVDQVAARVTDHTPVIGESSIRAALRHAPKHSGTLIPAAGSGFGAPGPGAAGTDPGSSSGAGANPSAGPGTGTTNGGVASNTSGSASPNPSNPNPSNPKPGTGPPPPPTSPPTQPAPPPPAPSASVIVIGGSVTASCASGTPNLISAIPANGFGTSVSRGAQLVVDFTSATHHSIVEAECDGTSVNWSTGEESAG